MRFGAGRGVNAPLDRIADKGGGSGYVARMRRAHADLLLLACAAVWGFAFLFQKSAMAHVGPLLFVAARGLVAAAVLLPLAVLEHRRSPALLTGRLAMMSGLAGAAFLAAAFLQQTGLVTASVTNTGFLTALYVMATPLISRALTAHPIAPVVWAAVGLSFAGTWLLGGGTVGGFGPGDYLVALSAPFWALHVVLVAIAAPLGRPVTFTALQLLTVGAVALVGAVSWEPVTVTGLREAAIEILYVGVLAGALTFTVLNLALRATSPSEATVIIATDTLFAALAGHMILGERLSPVGWLGAAAILAAVLMVQRAPAPQPPG